MSFKPYQQKSKLESISKFMKRMKSVLEKAKSAVYKVHDDMAKYYNWYYTSILVFEPSNKMFLDFSDIYTMYSSTKLLYCHLELYIVERWVEPISYCLKLSHILWHLYSVFHIVKLTSVSIDPIIIDEQEEWKVEKILNSCWHYKRYQYLIK